MHAQLHHTFATLFQVKDPSLLRFLVDMRGEDTTNKQLRDDLMVGFINSRGGGGRGCG